MNILTQLPEPLAAIASAAAVYRWGVISAAHATLRLMRDVRRYRTGG